jgi:hypothetical protein
MNWFWIVGIVANVTLTALAIVWVVRQGRPRGSDRAAADPAAPQDGQPPGESPSKNAN